MQITRRGVVVSSIVGVTSLGILSQGQTVSAEIRDFSIPDSQHKVGESLDTHTLNITVDLKVDSDFTVTKRELIVELWYDKSFGQIGKVSDTVNTPKFTETVDVTGDLLAHPDLDESDLIPDETMTEEFTARVTVLLYNHGEVLAETEAIDNFVLTIGTSEDATISMDAVGETLLE